MLKKEIASKPTAVTNATTMAAARHATLADVPAEQEATSIAADNGDASLTPPAATSAVPAAAAAPIAAAASTTGADDLT